MLFNAWVMPWISYPTLNVKMTTWRGFKRIYLSQIHVVHWYICVYFSCMMTFALVMIGSSKTIKCAWISSGSWRWNIFQLEKKVAECPLPAAQHGSSALPTKGTVLHRTVSNRTALLITVRSSSEVTLRSVVMCAKRRPADVWSPDEVMCDADAADCVSCACFPLRLFIFRPRPCDYYAGCKFWPKLKVSDHQAFIVSAKITSFSITAASLNPCGSYSHMDTS